MKKPEKYKRDSEYLEHMIEFKDGEVVFVEDGGDEVYWAQTNGICCCGDEFYGTGWVLFTTDHNNKDHYCFNPDFWYNSYWAKKDEKPGCLWTQEKPKIDYNAPYEQIEADYAAWGEQIKSHPDFKFLEDIIKDIEKQLNILSEGNGMFSDFKIEEFKYEAAVRVSCLKNGVKTGGWITWQNCD